MRLSIIIPVFKAEKYIYECLDSVLTGLGEDSEVILIDDGSPDQTMELIKNKYRAQIQGAQFKILRQENMGPGAARNAGVRASRGNYIGFLDADDILFPEYFDTIRNTLSNCSCDIVQFNYRRFTDLYSIYNEPVLVCHKSTGRFALDDVRNEIFGIGKWFPVTRVYRRSILCDRPFIEGVLYEDLMTIPFIFMRNYHIKLIDDCLYGYRVNVRSTTSHHTANHADMLVDFFVTLSKMPESVPINIIRIQVARTLSYFSAELNLDQTLTRDIIKTIREIELNHEGRAHLQYPDWFFFTAPRLYFCLDKWRVRRAKETIGNFA